MESSINWCRISYPSTVGLTSFTVPPRRWLAPCWSGLEAMPGRNQLRCRKFPKALIYPIHIPIIHLSRNAHLSLEQIPSLFQSFFWYSSSLFRWFPIQLVDLVERVSTSRKIGIFSWFIPLLPVNLVLAPVEPSEVSGRCEPYQLRRRRSAACGCLERPTAYAPWTRAAWAPEAPVLGEGMNSTGGCFFFFFAIRF